MRFFPRPWGALAALLLVASTAAAEEPSMVQEVRDLRQMVQLQSKQIDALSEQIVRLRILIETGKSPAALPEAAKPSADAAPEAPKAEAIPKAEAVSAGPKHIVVKGETLTSIAKHYNISIAELQKVNKIEDGRKLQIGQVLLLPANTKIPDPSAPAADKKETP